MSDESMVREYPDQKQRLAVGFSQWRQRHGKHKKIKEGQFNDHFWVVKEMQRRGILHKYEENVLEPELRPEYIKKAKKIHPRNIKNIP